MPFELDVPGEIADDDNYHEVLRVFISDDSVVQLRDVFGSESHHWGMLLADVAIHVARMKLQLDDVAVGATLREIESGYRGRMADQFNLKHQTLTGNN